PDVHFVDVIGAEDADVRRTLVLDDVEVLQHGVGAALEEARAEIHRRGHRSDVMPHLWRELPAAGEVLHERAGLVLRDDAELVDPGVDEVRQHDVDDPIAAPEGHRWLRPVAGQWIQALALAAGEDDPDDGGAARGGHRTDSSYNAAAAPGEVAEASFAGGLTLAGRVGYRSLHGTLLARGSDAVPHARHPRSRRDGALRPRPAAGVAALGARAGRLRDLRARRP